MTHTDVALAGESHDPSPSNPLTAIITWLSVPGTAYWRTHPDVLDAECALAPATHDGEEPFALKLSPRPPPAEAPEREWPRSAIPSREPEFELFMGGEPHPTFTDRAPTIDHVQLFAEASGSEDYPTGWWVARLWLSEPGRRMIAASLS